MFHDEVMPGMWRCPSKDDAKALSVASVPHPAVLATPPSLFSLPPAEEDDTWAVFKMFVSQH